PVAPPVRSTRFPYTTLFRSEVNEAAEIVQSAADANSNIIFGAVIDDALGEDVRVTVIATGFDQGGPRALREQPAARREREVTIEDRKSTRLNSSHLVISYAV